MAYEAYVDAPIAYLRARALEPRPSIEVQILYTQIDRDADNRPHFTRARVPRQSQGLFLSGQCDQAGGCPAGVGRSSINWVICEYALDRHTPVRIDSAYSGQTAVRVRLDRTVMG